MRVESKIMDEIICPECGRPNLVEAEKCWYCQVPLVDKEAKEDISEAVSESIAGQPDDKTTLNKSTGTEENGENLPEWLKRIRELKKADTPVEEVDQWQQEKLFPGLAQDTDKTTGRAQVISRPPRVNELPDPKPVIPKGQPMLDETPVENGPVKGVLSDDDVPLDKVEPGESENELPEGFTPLEH
jgi:hypothetical protein